MSRRPLRGALACLLTTIGLVAAMAAPATALTPPTIPPGGAPTGPVAPTEKTKRKQLCAEPELSADTDPFSVDPTGGLFDREAAWTFATGKGQTVAVIDTGVRPLKRLGRVIDGGDYVSDGNGLSDCDAHGTLVASLIAAAPSSEDSFSGIAPDSTILSIRQNSESYTVDKNGSDDDPNAVSPGYGNTTTLAYAITRAVNMGATVINISAAACGTESSGMDDDDVGRAVRNAFRRNVVVVTAAGNVDDGNCRQNPTVDPNVPREKHWPSMTTYASPAWFSDHVLSVGSLNRSAEASSFSLRGPWVSVAAFGEGVAALSNTGNGLVDELTVEGEPQPFVGTSFSAAVVSGVVALLRERYPDMTAGEIIELIKRTAQTGGREPDVTTGHGPIDPIAALTDPSSQVRQVSELTSAVDPASPADGADRARNIALIVGGVSIFLIAAAWALFTPLRRDRDKTIPYRDAVDDVEV